MRRTIESVTILLTVTKHSFMCSLFQTISPFCDTINENKKRKMGSLASVDFIRRTTVADKRYKVYDVN